MCLYFPYLVCKSLQSPHVFHLKQKYFKIEKLGMHFQHTELTNLHQNKKKSRLLN